MIKDCKIESICNSANPYFMFLYVLSMSTNHVALKIYNADVRAV